MNLISFKNGCHNDDTDPLRLSDQISYSNQTDCESHSLGGSSINGGCNSRYASCTSLRSCGGGRPSLSLKMKTRSPGGDQTCGYALRIADGLVGSEHCQADISAYCQIDMNNSSSNDGQRVKDNSVHFRRPVRNKSTAKHKPTGVKSCCLAETKNCRTSQEPPSNTIAPPSKPTNLESRDLRARLPGQGLSLSDSALSTPYHTLPSHTPSPNLSLTSNHKSSTMTSRGTGFARGRSLKNLVVLGGSFMLWMTSFTSLQILQSTLNPHDVTGGVTSVGVSSLLAIYVTTIVSCFMAPTVIRLLGAKWTVVGAYSLFLAYVGANFYPTDYLMLPASVLFGAMTGPLWSAQSTYLTTLALHYARNTKEMSDATLNRFNGLFAGLMQTSQVWGGALSAFVLSSDNSTVHLPRVATLRHRYNVSCGTRNHCGALDCQGSTAHLLPDHFVPHHAGPLPAAARTWLLGAESACVCLSIVLTAMFLDRSPQWRRSGGQGGHTTSEMTVLTQRSNDVIMVDAEVGNSDAPDVVQTAPDLRKQSRVVYGGISSTHPPHQTLTDLPGSRVNTVDDVSDTSLLSSFVLLLSSARLLKDPRLQLLSPLLFYTGLEQGFVISDFTKSYVNCALGIHVIGFVWISYGSVNAVTSFVIGHVGRHVKRVYIVTSGATFNAGILLVLTWWSPTRDDQAMFYVVASCLGLVDAIWQTQTNTLFGLLFADNQEAAFSCYRGFQTLGLVVAFASGQVCVSTKIYVLATTLAISLVFYSAVEYSLRRRIIRFRDVDGGVIVIL